MILKWLKKRKAERQQRNQRKMQEWEEAYFTGIEFPIIILCPGAYLCVSDLAEYFWDVDINIFFVNENCELIDSNGDKFNFKKIDGDQWVPDAKIEKVSTVELKDKVTPLLFMPSHPNEIRAASDVKDVINVLSVE
jgi:hypothetical protein